MKLEPQQQFGLPDGMIAISVDWLAQLVADSNELAALNAAGVDNWSGCSEVGWAHVETRNERHRLRVERALAS